MIKLCPDCLSSYKRSASGKSNRKNGILWGRNRWPNWLYHSAETRKCSKHAANATAYGAQRRAKKISASPSWADKQAIKKVYEDCRQISEFGVKYHVDHVIPLNSSVVCGLHVPANLEAIPAHRNIKKSNKFIPFEET